MGGIVSCSAACVATMASMTMAAGTASVASQCAPPATFSPLRSNASAAPSIRRCAAHSISRCRHFVRRAVTRSRAAASVRHAGRSCRSSRGPIASASARPSSMTPDRASCRWRRLPILRPITALAPRCVLTRFRGRWCTHLNMATGSGAAALAALMGAAFQSIRHAGRGSIASNRRADRCQRT